LSRHAYGITEADDTAGEGLRYPETVPRSGPPFPGGGESQRHDGSASHARESDDAALDGLGGASRAIGHQYDTVPVSKGARECPKPSRPSPRRRPADDFEAEATDETGHEISVPRAADEDSHAAVTVEIRQEEQTRVPDDIDDGCPGRPQRGDGPLVAPYAERASK
jgi:hypothetical protein